MASTRGVLAFLSLVPALVVANGHVASAAHLITKGGASQPERMHLGRDGRYRRELCPVSDSGMTCMASRLMPEGWTPDQPIPAAIPLAGAPASGMSPTDLLTAYKIPAASSAGGKIVAILDSPDKNAFSDLTAYRSAYGLPTLPKCTGNPTGTSPCFAQVSQSGGTSTGKDGGEGDGETALDMDMISAVCPDCSILLVELTALSSADILTGVKTAAKLGAVATSISLGGTESGQDTTGYTTAGNLVLAASGDFAYLLADEGQGATPSYPSSAPDIISVGGTALFKSGTSYDEGVWNDGTFATDQTGQDVTTSGCSTEFAMPSFQATALTGTGCTMRGTADVSAAATFFSGGKEQAIAIYATIPASGGNPASTGFIGVEGTSASSPIMAGIYARLGLTAAISANLGWEYTHMSAYNDLGSTAYPVDPAGSNTDAQSTSTCQNGALCVAKAGWDGPSGVGTPNGTALYALAGNSSSPDAGPTGSDGGGAKDASVGTGDDSGTSSTGDDSGTGYPSVDGSVESVGSDGGNANSPPGFGSPGGSSGCSCNSPGQSSPLGEGGMAMLALGAVALIGSRRRKS